MIETITVELTGSPDLDLMPPDDGAVPTLRDVILSSLLSDSRDDSVSGPLGTYRGGWAGDPRATDWSIPDRIGSRLWTVRRATLTEATLVRAEELAREALQWLVDDGIAEQVSVTVSRSGLESLQIGVTVARGRASAHSYLWGAS